MKELKVYECPSCHGSKTMILDWTAYNNLGVPIGYSDPAERRKLYDRAVGPCGECGGSGFVTKKDKDQP
jgi:hypothetical protein